jgi:hypothetical protein
MTEQGGPTPNEEGSDHSTGESIFNKERETKEDGRYIIFYTFEDEQES